MQINEITKTKISAELDAILIMAQILANHINKLDKIQ